MKKLAQYLLILGIFLGLLATQSRSAVNDQPVRQKACCVSYTAD
jgi:hypothetical protein